MQDILDKVKTVVLVMFENRSFDHMLGHLSREGINASVNGLTEPLGQYMNEYNGHLFTSFPIVKDSQLSFDLPHEHDFVATQLAQSPATGEYTMGGFVAAYAEATKIAPTLNPDPMGFFASGMVPITSFLAQNFCTCDNWFCPLPTSTQPNRTMAFCGDSPIFSTGSKLIEIQDSIFNWMERNNVRWRVYHDGFSFFALYNHLWPRVLGPKFRNYEYLYRDMLNEAADDAPQVIIVEPTYQDAPHFGSDHPNDNHAPLAIGWGEEFLRRTYEAVTANAGKWGNTVMIVYYDEHGGFYDHVPPPAIPYKTTGETPFQFNSLGPRVPAIIVSPLVDKGSVCNSLFDHTSVLQFLAEKFTPGVPYSQTVDDRANATPAIQSVSAALAAIQDPVPAPLVPSQPISVQTALGVSIATAPAGGVGQAFELAARQLIADERDGVNEKFPELLQWKDAVENARI